MSLDAKPVSRPRVSGVGLRYTWSCALMSDTFEKGIYRGIGSKHYYCLKMLLPAMSNP